MQSLDGIAQSLARALAFDAIETIGEVDDAVAKLVESLRLAAFDMARLFSDWLRSAASRRRATPRNCSSMRRKTSPVSLSLRATCASISSVSRRDGRTSVAAVKLLTFDDQASRMGASAVSEKLRRMRRVIHSPTERPSRRAAALAASRASIGMPATFQGMSGRISTHLVLHPPAKVLITTYSVKNGLDADSQDSRGDGFDRHPK